MWHAPNRLIGRRDSHGILERIERMMSTVRSSDGFDGAVDSRLK